MILRESLTPVATLETVGAKTSLHACAVSLGGWRKPEAEKVGGKSDLELPLTPGPRGYDGPAYRCLSSLCGTIPRAGGLCQDPPYLIRYGCSSSCWRVLSRAVPKSVAFYFLPIVPHGISRTMLFDSASSAPVQSLRQPKSAVGTPACTAFSRLHILRFFVTSPVKYTTVLTILRGRTYNHHKRKTKR
ncbi:hypothetical protein HJG60_009894 [Phyllostomus discolor]|uniref:Uncharacterized protein n=1 Tax=Phyllostomus discolor TaxID=89673 RepID=A0A834B910_9CHIR|nr:hypothetical protein HJG60_009894 [Phyllostomus discolor]